MKQSFRAVGMVVDRLSDFALQIAPEDASPNAVRVAVMGALVLLVLSFVKGLLSVRKQLLVLHTANNLSLFISMLVLSVVPNMYHLPHLRSLICCSSFSQWAQ